MSALFEDIKVRPMRDRSGVHLSSSGLQKLCERNAYLAGESGAPFAKKLLEVCNEVNSGIDVPRKSPRDNMQQWPLSIALFKPCNVQQVMADEKETEPAHVQCSRSEQWQSTPHRGQVKVSCVISVRRLRFGRCRF